MAEGKVVKIAGKIKIGNIEKEWEKIYESVGKASEKKPVTFSLADVESIDGSGLQLLIMLSALKNESPERYRIADLPEKVSEWSKNYGFEL